MNTISENTKLPISIILGLLTAVITIAAWGSRLEAKVESHEISDDSRVEKLQQRQDKTTELFYSIDRRLARIEGKLGVK